MNDIIELLKKYGWIGFLVLLVIMISQAGVLPTEPPTPGETPQPTATVVPGETPAPTATEEPPSATVVPTPSDSQRIVNPSFEGDYQQVEYPLYDGTTTNANEIKTAPGWLPYYCNSPYTPEDCEGMKTPEFTYADRKMPSPHDGVGGRVRSGEKAAKWFSTYDESIGGVYQTIQTIPGELCTVEAWVMTWFSYDENPASESDDANQRGASVWRIKVNLAGDIFGFATENLTSWDFGYGSGHYDRYTRIYFEFQANARQTTVFIENERNQPAHYNDSYLDDVTVHCVMPVSFFPDADENSRLH